MTTGTPSPNTVVLPTGWRTRINPVPGLKRLAGSANAIAQIVVAATGAYAFAAYVLGHPAPLLAATVTVSSLGLVRDARPRRVLETMLGMLLGILVAELLLWWVGSGWWQLALSLALAISVARFLSAQASFAIAAGLQSVIVMVVPTTAPMLRLLDGVIGGIAALVVTALIPRNPSRAEKRDGAALFRAIDAVMDRLAYALRLGDRMRAERGLEKARALGDPVERWRESLDSGLAIARVSPFLRRQRFELARHERIRESLDFAARNLRVIARRVVYLCDDGTLRPVAADILTDLSKAMALIEQSMDDIALEPLAREAIRGVALRLDPRALLPDASSGDQNLIAGLRPLTVDLLVAAGMPAGEARSCVPRI